MPWSHVASFAPRDWANLPRCASVVWAAVRHHEGKSFATWLSGANACRSPSAASIPAKTSTASSTVTWPAARWTDTRTKPSWGMADVNKMESGFDRCCRTHLATRECSAWSSHPQATKVLTSSRYFTGNQKAFRERRRLSVASIRERRQKSTPRFHGSERAAHLPAPHRPKAFSGG